MGQHEGLILVCHITAQTMISYHHKVIASRLSLGFFLLLIVSLVFVFIS